MISFDRTDLKIITVQNDREDATSLYLLMAVDMSDELNPEHLLDELAELEESDANDDQKDEYYQDLLDRMGIIEIFDQNEIEDLIEEGLIDPEDLHYSIYQIVTEEMDL